MKKEYRVTNEQAKSIKICSKTRSQCVRDCDWYNYDRCPFQNEKPTQMELDLSADLLDSRELIYKQTATIKEMRKFISTIQMDSVYDDIKAEALLNKTKDYQ